MVSRFLVYLDNPEDSAKLQLLAFLVGYQWAFTGDRVRYLDANYIYFYSDFRMQWYIVPDKKEVPMNFQEAYQLLLIMLHQIG